MFRPVRTNRRVLMNYSYEYRYEYPINHGMGDQSALAMLLTVYLVVIAVIFACTLAGYIFHSIGMYKIGKRMGRAYAWLAFIPFARDYFHGELAGEIPLKKKSIKNPGIWNLILPIIYGAVLGVIIIFFSIAVAGVGVAAQTNNMGMGEMAAFTTTAVGLYIAVLILVIVYSAVYSVLRILIDIQIYERFTTRNMAAVHAVLSGIVPFYEALCFFVLRNKPFQPGMEPKIAPPPVPPVMPGGPIPNGPAPGGPMPGQQMPDNPAPGSPMPGQQMPNNPVPGSPMPGQQMPDNPAPGGPMPGQQDNKTE